MWDVVTVTLVRSVLQNRCSYKFCQFSKKKSLCRSLFLRNVLTYNLRLKKSFWHRCFPWNLVKFLRAPNLQTNFVQTSPPEMFLGKDVLKICSKTPMPKCKFNKLAMQFYWNRTSTLMFSMKFAAYFQNNFP